MKTRLMRIKKNHKSENSQSEEETVAAVEEWLPQLRGVQIYRSHSREYVWPETAMVGVWRGNHFLFVC